ncbi:Nif11-like leader peptide family RiPP precursor, partial [Synechococcus sp. WH 8016]|uniref:Nif11-like leader peptide family RiPP precursor n=1 Tax=Synechococcus sp. WH 8016 TaxID=166318 RepID=UPI00022D7F77
ADANAVTAIAKEAGFIISADDLTKAQSELSERELEGVVGGTVMLTKAQSELSERELEGVVGGTVMLTKAQSELSEVLGVC